MIDIAHGFVKPAEVLFLKQPWLITPEAHAAMVAAARSMFDTHPPQIAPEAESPLLSIEDGVGVIAVNGPIIRKPGLIAQILFGATDTDELIAAVAEAGERPDVSAVLFDIDSPGGSVNGTPELAQAVADLSRAKYVYAFSAGQMCSAAYWVASQCDAIYATPSARVGSIGVILPVIDSSEAMRREGIKVEVFAAGKYKSAGTPGVPLTDDQRQWLQSDVEEIAGEFHAAVLARGRKIPAEAMEGQTFSARKAMRFNLAGMAKNRDEVLGRLRSLHVRSAVPSARAVDTGTGGEMKTLDQELEEARQQIAQMETAHAAALDAAKADLQTRSDDAAPKVVKLEADAQAREALLSEAATKADSLTAELAEAQAGRERIEADLTAARQNIESLTGQKSEIEAQLSTLTSRNKDLEAREQDIETRASKRAVEIVASTGTQAPAPVTPKGDRQTEDLVARFKAISDPKEQTLFWRSLTAQQQAQILSSTANQ